MDLDGIGRIERSLPGFERYRDREWCRAIPATGDSLPFHTNHANLILMISTRSRENSPKREPGQEVQVGSDGSRFGLVALALSIGMLCAAVSASSAPASPEPIPKNTISGSSGPAMEDGNRGTCNDLEAIGTDFCGEPRFTIPGPRRPSGYRATSLSGSIELPGAPGVRLDLGRDQLSFRADPKPGSSELVVPGNQFVFSPVSEFEIDGTRIQFAIRAVENGQLSLTDGQVLLRQKVDFEFSSGAGDGREICVLRNLELNLDGTESLGPLGMILDVASDDVLLGDDLQGESCGTLGERLRAGLDLNPEAKGKVQVVLSLVEISPPIDRGTLGFLGIRGPSSVKAGRKVKVEIPVTNRGRGRVTRAKICITSSSRALRGRSSTCRRVSSVRSGARRVVSFRVNTKKRRCRKGKRKSVEARFRVSIRWTDASGSRGAAASSFSVGIVCTRTPAVGRECRGGCGDGGSQGG